MIGGTMKPREPRTVSQDDIEALRAGLELLKAARDRFQSAGARRAYLATLRAIKSADGAVRHADNVAVRQKREQERGRQRA
jgi:hypothetical protein